MTDFGSVIARAAREGRVPSISAGVLRGGEVAWLGSTADVEAQYRIGSITKTFIAVEIMRLRDEGRLAIDDTIGSHLPEVSFGNLTIAQLLSHTSGMQAETNGPWWERNPGGTWRDLLASRIGPVLTPGTRFHYSNVGFAVLGRLVEQLRGCPWFEAITAGILLPLGLERTSLRPVAPAATGYAVHPQRDERLVEPEFDAGAMAPAGQLWAPIGDLAKWAQFIGGDTGDVLSSSTLEEMSVPMAVTDLGSSFLGAQGLGVHIWISNNRRLVGHGGSMPGFVAGLWIEQSTGDGFVQLANSTAGMPDIGAELLGEAPAPAATEPLAAEDVANLVGQWWWGPQTFTLTPTIDGFFLGNANGRRASRFVRDGDAWRGLDSYFAGETLRVLDDSTLDLASFVLTREPYPGGDWQPS